MHRPRAPRTKLLRMAVPEPWDCPICLRRVPAKVAECYCGEKRAAGAGSKAGSGEGVSALGIGMAVLLLAGGAAAYLRQRASVPPPLPEAATTTPRPAPSGGSAAAPSVSTVPAAWKALAIEATPSPSAPAPVVTQPGAVPGSPTPTPSDSIDAQREKGLAAFEATLTSLDARAAEFREKLRRYDDQCASASTHVVGCDSFRSEIASLAREIASGVENAEEQARRSWVDPGRQRESRERHGLDDDAIRDLLKSASEAQKR